MRRSSRSSPEIAIGSTGVALLLVLGLIGLGKPMRSVAFGLAMLVALAVVSSAALAQPSTHWCRGGDPPILVSRWTSCAFAGRVVNRVYNGPVLTRGGTRTISVRSPVTGQLYRLRLTRRLNHVTATGPNRIFIRFFYDGG